MPGALLIGGVESSPPLVLAPLAGITDTPFRLACRAGGAGLLFSEMVSARGLCYRDRRTASMARAHPREHPLAVQLFGRHPEEMARAAAAVAESGADLVDINMGCPVRKVLKGGAGVQLMREPELAASLVRAAAGAAGVPVTVKFRLGWSREEENYVEFGLMMQEAGAAAVTLHPRTRVQGFTGSARWEAIAALKEALEVPVLGSGDVKEPEDALRMFQDTGCDAVMVGRGTLGRPWIFSRMEDALTGRAPTLDREAEVAIMCAHLEAIAATLPSRPAVGHLRKHLSWYSHGLPHGAAFRDRVNHLQEVGEIMDAAEAFFPLPPLKRPEEEP